MKTKCAFCAEAAVLKSGTSTYRRGGKSVTLTTQFWECPSDCAGPDGDKPFQFVTAPLMKANDAAARKAWKTMFKEEMPKSPFQSKK